MIKRELCPFLWGLPGGYGIRMEKAGQAPQVWSMPPDLFISGGQHWLLLHGSQGPGKQGEAIRVAFAYIEWVV